MGQMTQTTVSKHWRKTGSWGLGFNRIRSTSPCYNNTVLKHTKYNHINTYAQWNVPSVTKPNPKNCKNCSSKCAYNCAQLQHTIQHRTVLKIHRHVTEDTTEATFLLQCPFIALQRGNSCSLYHHINFQYNLPAGKIFCENMILSTLQEW